MKPIIAVIVFSFIAALTNSFCQYSEPVNTAQSQKKQRDLNLNKYPSLKIASEKMAKATESSDAKVIVDLTYSKYLKMFGGREAVLDLVVKGFDDLKTKDGQIVSLKAEMPNELAEIDNDLFSLVPLTMTVKTPDGLSKGTDSMIAVSEDDGVTWSFITGVSQSELEKLFPKVAEKIKIPEPKSL